MTREEARDILKNTKVRFGRTNGKTVYAEALHMAIKALEQPEIIRCKDCKYRGGWSGFYCDIMDKFAGDDKHCAWAERRTDEVQNE